MKTYINDAGLYVYAVTPRPKRIDPHEIATRYVANLDGRVFLFYGDYLQAIFKCQADVDNMTIGRQPCH